MFYCKEVSFAKYVTFVTLIDAIKFKLSFLHLKSFIAILSSTNDYPNKIISILKLHNIRCTNNNENFISLIFEHKAIIH